MIKFHSWLIHQAFGWISMSYQLIKALWRRLATTMCVNTGSVKGLKPSAPSQLNQGQLIDNWIFLCKQIMKMYQKKIDVSFWEFLLLGLGLNIDRLKHEHKQ